MSEHDSVGLAAVDGGWWPLETEVEQKTRLKEPKEAQA